MEAPLVPRDLRTYITVHDGMPDHPKIASLSDGAFRLLIESWCWCAKYQTDGKMLVNIWTKHGTAKIRAELVAAGLVESAEDGFIYWHDFLEHQQSAAERAAMRQQKVDAGRKGGQAKAVAGAKQVPEQVPEQVPSEDVAALAVALNLGSSKHSSAPPPSPSAFDRFWAAYPLHVGRGAAVKAFEKAQRKVAVEVLIAGAMRFRNDPNREQGFTPHGSTWLNAERWSDDPLPSRAPVLRAVAGNPANLNKEWS